MGIDDDPRFPVESRAEWRHWLEVNHEDVTGVWAVTFRKGSGGPIVNYEDLVEEALCFGWVDSVGRKLDERRTMLRFSPRKLGSKWSRPNKERVARLERDGLIAPAGAAAITSARADGSWSALDDVENLIVPDDLAEAFDRNPGSAERWEAFPRSAKRAILEWIVSAKRPEIAGSGRDVEDARFRTDPTRIDQTRPERQQERLDHRRVVARSPHLAVAGLQLLIRWRGGGHGGSFSRGRSLS